MKLVRLRDAMLYTTNYGWHETMSDADTNTATSSMSTNPMPSLSLSSVVKLIHLSGCTLITKWLFPPYPEILIRSGSELILSIRMVNPYTNTILNRPYRL